MLRLRTATRLFALTSALIASTYTAALASGPRTTPALSPTDTAGALPPRPVTALWNPLLDGVRAHAPPTAAAAPGPIRVPLSSAVNPNFGGFRVAPSTPAHAAGDTARDLSSVEADVDHDGCKDIVTFQFAHLTVMRGDCHGGFSVLQSQSTAFNVYHPIAVDLNHDGYPDIVAMTVPFAYLGSVVALINQRNGAFSPPTVISKKASVYSGLMAMNVADINGDGNADVIIAGLGTMDTMTNSNLVFEVIFGNADGSFATSTLVETLGTAPYKPTFAFDGGTALRKIGDQLYLYGLMIQARRVNDINFGSELLYRWAVSSTGAVDVANPEIAALPMFSSAPNKYVQFADLDGDGVDDFTLLNGDGMLYTAIGHPDGSLGQIQPALPLSAGNNASVLSFRDIDGDGKVDAIMAGGVFLGAWPGNGDGTFRAPAATHAGGYAFNANSGLTFPVSNHVIDDFDGDGVADIAFFDTVKRALSFYKGVPDGTFVGAPSLVSTTGDFQTNGLIVLATPDLNGDGYPDIVVSSYYGLLGGINDRRGGFVYQVLSPLQQIAGISSQTADFNRDGKDDVVILGVDQDGGVHLYLGLSNGDGTVTAVAQPLPFSSASPPGIAIGDINGDGAPDLVLALNNFASQSYGLWPMVNDGTGALAAGAHINQGAQLFGVAAADANGDGAADLFVSSGSFSATTTAVYLATGSGGFAAAPSAVLQNTMVGAGILTQDVTGDGAVDAVLSVVFGASQGLVLYTGHRDGTFSAGVPLVTGVNPTYVGATDLNGDAIPDLYFTTTEAVLTDAADALMGLVVLRGTGNAGFASPVHYNIYGSSSPVLPIDLFHNGSPSLFAASGNATTTILLNRGGSTLTLGTSATSLGSDGAIDVTVRVAPAFSDQPLPTGNVNLLVDGAVANHSALQSDGIAAFHVSGLSVGSHRLSATYDGDGNYNGNLHSATADLIVTKADPAFVLTSDTAALSLSLSGGEAKAALSLAANTAFSGPVTLACDGAPSTTTCAFSQTNVTLAPGQTVTSTLTLTSETAAWLPPHTLIDGAITGACGVGLVLLLALARRRNVTGKLTLAIVAALTAVGCSSDTASPSSATGYAITITATPSDTSVPAQLLTLIVESS